jgi:aspartate aminotransferase
MRKALADGLQGGSSSVDFSFMYRQNGMFSYSGLSKEQVDHLRSEYAIYMPGSGRINVAGLSPKNMDYVVEAIVSVL